MVDKWRLAVMRALCTGAVVASLVAFFAPAMAQALHQGTGTIRGIYRAEKSIVITHDPMPSLRMGAMTMPFDVADPKLLDGLKPDQAVEFEVRQRGADLVIQSIKPRK